MSATDSNMVDLSTPRIHPKWMLASGNWLFRIRNALFPSIFLAVAVLTRPAQFLNNPEWDRIVMTIGAAIALTGQAFRMFVIGFAYIKRGGLNGKVYAKDLVVAGLFAHCRNPMYVGNLLIAIGVCIFYGSIWMYVLVIPFFIWVYLAITAAEEQYLLGRFGPTYEDYMKNVNRFIPDFRGLSKSLSGFRYQWRTVLRKEYGTLFGTLAGLTLIAIWKKIYLCGWPAQKQNLWFPSALLGLWALFYIVVRTMKKTGRLKEPVATP